ncbi:Excinuclease ABC subunit C [gamma proteobacterium IMCC2047]|nr:Excinuclease ABC subunit C [gamma proteobacterium IMCC2047]
MTAFDSKTFLTELTRRPGVYQMLDDAGKVLYVGKAKNLKNRVSSYFRNTGLSIKTQSLMAKAVDVQVTVTASETEALLLEQNLIKSLKPPYNILLRDDKSYPFIFLTDQHEYPSLGLHRGAKRKNVRYFGPFPNVSAVRETLSLLQKSFKVRQCDESHFKNRSRPCLQYQIERCKAPCVEYISKQAYAEDVRHTRMFLEGKDREIITELTTQMEQASAALDFEKAAELRDQVIHLRRVQEQQYVSGHSGDVDVVAGLVSPMGICVQVLFIRAGRILGSRTYYPKVNMVSSLAELLSGFIPQFYLAGSAQHQIPKEVILNAELEDEAMLADALAQSASHKVQLTSRVRGDRARWLQLAINNAEQNLQGRHASNLDYAGRLTALQAALELSESPKRMECFDISHSSGESTVASCVVFDDNGPLKSDYRRFNISGITGGDDYAAMQQALKRRYKRLKSGEGKLPDILFIDGGKGQLRMAEDVLAELDINGVLLVGVAKGVTRKAGLESLFMAGRSDEIVLPPDSPALHLIQHIRDEAHRFAITSHRQARGKTRRTSPLESIPGVGPKRRRELLTFFGGIQEVERASAEEIAKVPGISKSMAEEIYASLRNE